MDHRIVNESTRFFKNVAKSQLKGKWLNAAIAAGIFMLIVNIMDVIVSVLMLNATTAFLSNIYYFLVYGPATVGMCAYFMKLIRNEPNGLGSCFEGFETFGRSFSLGFFMIIFISLWTLLLIIPGIIAAYRYSLAPMLLRDRPDLSPLQCISESKRLMRGNKADLFTLDISFIGWMLLAMIPQVIVTLWIEMSVVNGEAALSTGMVSVINLITLIPVLWVMAYMESANVVFYEEVIRPVPQQFYTFDNSQENVYEESKVLEETEYNPTDGNTDERDN